MRSPPSISGMSLFSDGKTNQMISKKKKDSTVMSTKSVASEQPQLVLKAGRYYVLPSTESDNPDTRTLLTFQKQEKGLYVFTTNAGGKCSYPAEALTGLLMIASANELFRINEDRKVLAAVPEGDLPVTVASAPTPAAESLHQATPEAGDEVTISAPSPVAPVQVEPEIGQSDAARHHVTLHNELPTEGRHHVTSDAKCDLVTTSELTETPGGVVATTEGAPLGTDYSLVEQVGQYLTDFVRFCDPMYELVLALFVILTHCWFECFDCAPHVVITSGTKRSAKTTLMELMSFASARAINISSITVAALYHEITNNNPVLYIDEAEKYNSEKSEYRPIINGGYRRGQFVIRNIGGVNVHSTNFCPKVFCLIGDVYDTLRDRTITIVMRRGKAPREYIYTEAASEGEELSTRLRSAIQPRHQIIKDTYVNYSRKYNTLSFLTARDREIWKPLFTLCQLLCPSRIPELERSAVDIAGYKTQDIRRFSGKLAAEEKEADDVEYGEMLLRDMLGLMKGRHNMATSELVHALRALRTSPWRVYRGSGLTDDRAGAMLMSALLSRFGVEPGTIRVAPRGQAHDTIKGYKTDDVVKAAAKYGIGLLDAPAESAETPDDSVEYPVRTKEAVIEIFCDGEGAIVSAYQAAEFDAYDPDSDDEPPTPLFDGECTMERPTDASGEYLALPKDEHDRLCALEEQNASLQVLGWLWRNGFKSARWGCKISDGAGPDESQRPDWATKDVYVWSDAPDKL